MTRKLFISEPAERHTGPILIHDEDHNDIAEFYHNEHATVEQTYEEALFFARLVTKNVKHAIAPEDRMIDHGNGMGGPAGTSEVNAANRDALRRLDRQPAHRVVQIAVIDWANSLNGRAPVGEDLARLIQTLTGRVEADRVSRS